MTEGHSPVTLNWDEYFLRIAQVVSLKSTCLTRHIGAIIVKDHHILGTGYNGTVVGAANCDKGGCPRCTRRIQGLLKSGEATDSCLCAHAETNAIVQAARHGIPTLGATMYCYCGIPCAACSKVVANAGIVNVVCLKEHASYDPYGIQILKSANITITELAG